MTNIALSFDVGTEEGSAVLAEVPHRSATTDEMAAADAVVAYTSANMGRVMHADDVHELSLRNLDHPRWDEVATRCLTCGNCNARLPDLLLHHGRGVEQSRRQPNVPIEALGKQSSSRGRSP